MENHQGIFRILIAMWYVVLLKNIPIVAFKFCYALRYSTLSLKFFGLYLYIIYHT